MRGEKRDVRGIDKEDRGGVHCSLVKHREVGTTGAKVDEKWDESKGDKNKGATWELMKMQKE